MALYDGFFDAVQDENTGEYDRAYGPGDFTGYFANVIGSGVCIHDNPDSFKAEYEGGTLYLRPGYLFIQGYWLANKVGEGESNYKGYAVPLPAGMTGSMAVVAHLNLGQRLIEIEVRAVSQAYPDALVLAIITASTAEDTRHNTDICGVIDTAGELSSKVEWALNYINTEIESKLQQVEADIAAQELKLDAKIAEVQAVADNIVPPPVGSIKFSASQDVGPEWLQCNGDFISESQYPELVAALGKLTPSGDKFHLISNGEIGANITNGVLYGNRIWTYSFSEEKLYGIDKNGGTLKEISIECDSPIFKSLVSPTPAYPIALSIVPHIGKTGARLFLAQIIGEGRIAPNSDHVGFETDFLLFSAEFTGSETTMSLNAPVTTIKNGSPNYHNFTTAKIPYVISRLVDDVETYYCLCASPSNSNYEIDLTCIMWDDSGTNATVFVLPSYTETNITIYYYRTSLRTGFSRNNKDEVVSVIAYTKPYNTGSNRNHYAAYKIASDLNGIFQAGPFASSGDIFDYMNPPSYLTENARTTRIPLAIAGTSAVVYDIQTTGWAVAGVSDNKYLYMQHNVSLPTGARIFYEPGVYLFGKDIYLIFVGTGILFFRDFTSDSVGYLDTTSVLGTITQHGMIIPDYDENTLYLMGQDTTNTVKVAKMELNTLYDYANDGAWLPMIAADGVPAYIKAKETGGGIVDPVPINVTVTNKRSEYIDAILNGEPLFVGSYARNVSQSGTFTVGGRVEKLENTNILSTIKINGTAIGTLRYDTEGGKIGDTLTKEFKTSDFLTSGIKIDIT